MNKYPKRVSSGFCDVAKLLWTGFQLCPSGPPGIPTPQSLSFTLSLEFDAIIAFIL